MLSLASRSSSGILCSSFKNEKKNYHQMIDWNFDKYYTILWQLFTIAYKQALIIVLLHQHFLATINFFKSFFLCYHFQFLFEIFKLVFVLVLVLLSLLFFFRSMFHQRCGYSFVVICLPILQERKIEQFNIIVIILSIINLLTLWLPEVINK